MLKKEFEYFLEHHSEFLKKYNGKFLVIKGNELLGAYPSKEDAISTTIKDHELGTFLVQLCLPGEDAYTQKFYSRVVF